MTASSDLPRAVAGILFVGIVVVAAAFRIPALDDRPMHTDEAVHAVKFGRLLDDGFYRYDPHEYHGPTLNYFSFVPARLAGQTSSVEVTARTFRLVPAVFGLGSILLLLLLPDALGRTGLVAAALLSAVSPILVYYSRYYIQEMLLVFFAAALICFCWRYARRPGWMWALLIGAAAGLMHATKETCVFHFVAVAIALVLCPRPDPAPRAPGFAQAIKRSLPHMAGAIAAAMILSGLFYSSFSRHPEGLLDSILTYFNFIGRAEGRGHEKPWFWYVSLLGWRRAGGFRWSEAFILLLAVSGAGAAWFGQGGTPEQRRFGRFVSLYTAILMLIYCLIPYKTPWLMTGVIQPATLLGGLGIAIAWQRWPRVAARTALVAVLLAGCADLAVQARRGSRTYAADERNPYVYSHTAPDCVRLARMVEDLSAVHPDGRDMVIKIMSEEYWPLPWYLRSFSRVGYWNDVAADPRADVVITSGALAEDVASRLEGRYVSSLFGLRPGVILVLYVKQQLWDDMYGHPAASFDHHAMGTTFSITIATPDRAYAAQAAASAFDVLDGVEKHISHYDESSEISLVKRLATGERYRVSDDTMACLLEAARIHEQTKGAFDVGLGALLEVWTEAKASNRSPSDETLSAVLRRSGMDRVVLDPDRHELWTTVSAVELDLGGIGKGFALDRMAEVLAEWGLTNALLQASRSTVLAVGAPPGEAGWGVGWSHGEEGEDLFLRDRAMSASGTSVLGAHILNPRTGRPVDHHERAWAVAPTAAEADALSTAFMVMNVEEISDYCVRHPEIRAMVLKGDAVLRLGEAAAVSRRVTPMQED